MKTALHQGRSVVQFFRLCHEGSWTEDICGEIVGGANGARKLHWCRKTMQVRR
jgi:hypothetical protein